MVNENQFFHQLKVNAQRICALVDGVSTAQAIWKPAPENWSILEVINHLYDEERYDFRVRIDYTLNRPGQDWPPIDPTGWAIAHHYQEHTLETSLQNFLKERQASINWLSSLHTPDWNIAKTAPWGSITAGDLLAAWVAHDTLHMRQLVELHHDFVVQLAQPYNVEYAGRW